MRILFVLLFIVSCGEVIKKIPFKPETNLLNYSSDNSVQEESYTYSFYLDNCHTEQFSKTLAGICSKLLDEKLNSGCAKDERKELFENECN